MRSVLPILLLVVLADPACQKALRNMEAKGPVPNHWARPVQRDDLQGLMVLKWNGVLYNGAQPQPQQFAVLKKMGIRSVVNVRRRHSDQHVTEWNGMRYMMWVSFERSP